MRGLHIPSDVDVVPPYPSASFSVDSRTAVHDIQTDPWLPPLPQPAPPYRSSPQCNRSFCLLRAEVRSPYKDWGSEGHLERGLRETDCPYLALEEVRSREGESLAVPHPRTTWLLGGGSAPLRFPGLLRHERPLRLSAYLGLSPPPDWSIPHIGPSDGGGFVMGSTS